MGNWEFFLDSTLRAALNEERLVSSFPAGGTEATKRLTSCRRLCLVFFPHMEPDCEELRRGSIKSQIKSRFDGELMDGSQSLSSASDDRQWNVWNTNTGHCKSHTG